MRKCGGCSQPEMKLLFSLGDIPPVNAFLLPSEIKSEIGYPLDLYYCPECTLVQLGECVPPEKLFSHYLHLSSASGSNVRHLKEVADWVAEHDDQGLKGKRVLEIGSNDGTLLAMLKQKAGDVLGVDPAKNLAEDALRRGVRTISDFFLEEKAAEIIQKEGTFDWVVALNVVPHTPNFTSLLRGVRAALKPGGRFMLEGAYVVDTILNGQFDTIYHEHVYNFSLHALKFALERAGFKIIDVEIIPTQGTSFRVFACRSDESEKESTQLKKLLDAEKSKGFTDLKAYERAADKIKKFSIELKEKIAKLKRDNQEKIVALGAPARGVVILNYCGIGTDDIEYVIDDTVLKQGRLTPGVHIPVTGWEELAQNPKKSFLLLSWNYREEVLKKLRACGAKGTLIVPFPNLEEVQVG